MRWWSKDEGMSGGVNAAEFHFEIEI